jgi:NNP family nitrate/nitrite transporter-like MFS transporter
MSHSSIPEKTNSSVISDWRPEDPEFWQQRGHRVASRNLWISVPCLLLAFCVWMLFSAVAVNLNKVGFQFTTDQLFMLTALSGASLRVPYAFMVPLFGGRRWTAFSTGIMIVPCVWVRLRGTGYLYAFSVFVIISLLCGFAGRTLLPVWLTSASSFRNRKGGALGINGLGNMGVSVMQLVALWWFRCRFSPSLAVPAASSRTAPCCIWKTRRGSGCRS